MSNTSLVATRNLFKRLESLGFVIRGNAFAYVVLLVLESYYTGELLPANFLKMDGTVASELIPPPSLWRRRMVAGGKLSKPLRVPRVTDARSFVGGVWALWRGPEEGVHDAF